ncbi:MAG: hypothetical protein AAFX02_10405, partial [Pseudomonadota bacterium]
MLRIFDEDFETFLGAGFASAPVMGQLDSDVWAVTGFSDGALAFGGTADTGDFARGVDADGGVTSGGIYAFTTDGGTNTIFGFQPGGSDATPGTFTIQVVNTTGIAQTDFTLAYDLFVNNDQSRANSLNVEVSTDGSTFSAVNALDFTSTEVADALGFQSFAQSASFTTASVAAGASLFVRFTTDDVAGSGSRDEFGLDNITLDAALAPLTTVLSESFETDGNGTRYTTSTVEFTDGGGDFFLRTDGSDVGSFYDVSGQDGSFFFAGQDLDGEGAAASQTLNFTGLEISGLSNLSFSIDVAEDDDGSNQDWDADTALIIEYQIDGGGFQSLLAFEATGGTNTEPAQDTDFDGVGDGTTLTNIFQSFTASIAGTGSLLDIRVTFDNLDAGDEDAAIDNIVITGEPAATPTTVLAEGFETDGNGTRYTTSTAEFTDGAGDFFLRTDGSDIGSFYEVTGQEGSFFFAGQDLDGEGAAGSQTLNFTGLDISGLSDLGFSIDVAED